MKEEQGLLPCPFCGLIPSLHNSYSKWIVIHKCDYINSVGGYGRKIEVIEKWNTRTPIVQQPLSGSADASPKCPADASDNGKR